MARTRRSEGSGLLFWGIMLGAAIGAGVALFYSPGTGDDNREHLMEWVQARMGG